MFTKDFRNLVFSFVEEKNVSLVENIFLKIILEKEELSQYFFKKNIKEIKEHIELKEKSAVEKDVLFNEEKKRLNNVFKEILKIKADFKDAVEISETDFVYYVLESNEIEYLKDVLLKNKKIEYFKTSYIEEKNNSIEEKDFAMEIIKKASQRLKVSKEDFDDELSIEKSVLSKYTNSLSEQLNEKSAKNIIGRDKELKSLIRSLSRKDKNNPIVIGEPGVGKTALVEGLAIALEKDEVPAAIEGFKVLSLDLASLTAGTKYRGDFEERFKELLHALIEDKKTILFIDEIHSIMNASSQGTSSFGNLLKPYLTKDLIKVIGATTFDEYSKHIEPDAALTRRFNKIIVEKPTEEATIQMIKGSIDRYEEFHGVLYSDDIINKTVSLSEKYLTNKNLPDKAFDLIDEIGVITSEKHEKEVSLNVLEEVVKEKVGIKDTESLFVNRMKGLPKKLKEKIYGQDHVVDKVVDSILLSRSGFVENNRPESVFMFLGSSGVGKTELANQLSKTLNMNLIRMDMSEYSDSSTANKFIGASSGYVGFEDGGVLTNEVMKNPHSVILLDEIEKAHSSIFNLLLQVFDNGFITDGKGRTIDFRHSIIIMTSNIGLNEEKKASIGFMDSASNPMYDVNMENYFPIEFINRIDEVFKFNYLEETISKRIVEKEILELKQVLSEKFFGLKYEKEVLDFIVKETCTKNYGARPIKRYVHTNLSTKIAREIILNDLESGTMISICIESNELKFCFEK